MKSRVYRNTRLLCSLGFPLFEYDAELLAWIVRHQTQMTSENMNMREPVRLPVAHIRVAMEYFIDNIDKSPQYEKYKESIEKDLDATRRLYEIKFGIRPIDESQALGTESEVT